MSPVDSQRLPTQPADASAGSDALQISNAIGRIHKQLVGRGPTGVSTHIARNVVVCLLEGGFTRAEETVYDNGGAPAVMELRVRLQAAMKPAIIEAVEAVTGRRVRSFMSANDPGADIQAEIIVLDATAPPSDAS